MLSIRKVEGKDCKKLFHWANDPQTRQNSLNSNEIDYETHVKWFENKLKDENSHLYICYKDYEDIALVRFEIKEDQWFVSIVVDPSSRGKGYGKETLAMGLGEFAKLYDKELFAQIKEDNIGSIKIFESNDFKIIENKNSVLKLKWNKL